MITAKDFSKFVNPEDQCPMIQIGQCAECKQFRKRNNACNLTLMKVFNAGEPVDKSIRFLKHFNPRNHWLNCEFWNKCASGLTIGRVMGSHIIINILTKDPNAEVFIKGRSVPVLEAIKEFFKHPDTIRKRDRRYGEDTYSAILAIEKAQKLAAEQELRDILTAVEINLQMAQELHDKYSQ